MGRIRYGIKNTHYALVTKDDDGKLTYDKPVAILGTKSMSLDAQGEDVTEYADDGIWFQNTTNNGYSGTLEFEDTESADTFLTAVCGWTKDETTGVVTEKSSDTPVEFALLTQFTLDGEASGATGKRVKFYRVKASRPSVSGSTKESSITVATNSINITCLPRLSDDVVKATATSKDSAYESWFSAVE